MVRARRELAFSFLFVAAACTTGAGDAPDPASACAGKAVPPHACVGGARELRCTTLASGETRWQIDCIRQDATKPVDAGASSSPPRGMSPCEAQACGPTPAWDEGDCVHGFYGEPSCSSIDRGACTWGRFCRPKPCTPEDPTCNVLHPERLGRACDGNTPCPSGSNCNTIVANLGDDEPQTVCIAGNPCDALTCAPGKRCRIALSDPGQVSCTR